MPRFPSFVRAGWRGLCLSACLLLPALLSAQGAAPKRPVTYGLKLEPSAEIAAGKIAMVKAEAGQEPDHYVVENLTILQPVQVVLVVKDPADDVKIQLCKHLWDQPEREESTGGKGAVHFSFRTEGDLRIKVQANGKPCTYYLTVWAGDALQRPMRSAFVPMTAASRFAGGPMALLASPVLWIIAGILFLIFIMLLVLVVRGRRK